MKGDPTSFEETTRGVNTSKWQEAKEIEMKSMNTNEVSETETVPNTAKTAGCNGSTRRNVTPKKICKDVKRDLNQKILCKENE
jgi:hypothetical protein